MVVFPSFSTVYELKRFHLMCYLTVRLNEIVTVLGRASRACYENKLVGRYYIPFKRFGVVAKGYNCG